MRRKLIADEPKAKVVENTTEIADTELSSLVDSYIYNKEQESKFKNLASSENTKIKTRLSELKITSYSGSNGGVKLTERKSEKFDDEGMIAFLKDNGHSDIVKTKEYVDFDALESAIYHSKLSKDEVKQLDGFKTVTITPVLNITKGE